MHKTLTLSEIEKLNQDRSGNKKRLSSTLELNLIDKKIPLKFCEYKISNTSAKMLSSESIAISEIGLLFISRDHFSTGTIMRIWVEIPDYWDIKSKHVDYQHTEAPSYFQVLARVMTCEESIKDRKSFHVLCETLSMDPIDQFILKDYLNQNMVEKQ